MAMTATTVEAETTAPIEPVGADEALEEPTTPTASRWGPEAITSFLTVAAAVIFTISQHQGHPCCLQLG